MPGDNIHDFKLYYHFVWFVELRETPRQKTVICASHNNSSPFLDLLHVFVYSADFLYGIFMNHISSSLCDCVPHERIGPEDGRFARYCVIGSAVLLFNLDVSIGFPCRNSTQNSINARSKLALFNFCVRFNTTTFFHLVK